MWQHSKSLVNSVFSFLLVFLPVVVALAQPAEKLHQTPLTPKPVFSHQAGFYTSGFNLEMASGQTGVYSYTVTAPGYQAVSGQVTITDADRVVEVILPQSPAGKMLEDSAANKNLFTVTFRVNTTGSNVVAGDNVYMSGNIVSPPWPVPGTVQSMLMQPEAAGSAIYTLNLSLIAGQYQYKYFRNDGWVGGEWGGTPNREINVTGNMVVNDLFGDINPPLPLFKATFVVLDSQRNPITNASITFAGVTYSAGTYLFEDLKPAAVIRYTTDGSIPTATSPVYTGSIFIDRRAGSPNVVSLIPTNNINWGSEMWRAPIGEVFKINTIRARSFAPRMAPGPVATASYIVDAAGAARYSVPLVSINAHRGAFFDPDSGIYVLGRFNNYFQNDDAWERLVHFEFFEENGNLAISQNMGVRTHGGATRNRPRKSLRLYAREEYGQSWVNYQFFADKPIFRFKRFLLRNSGNDWDQSIFRDSFMQSLLKDMVKIDLQYSRPVVVFINGEYWGVHNVRDRFDERFIETHYGLDSLEYAMLENNAVFDNGNPDGVAHYQEMLSFIQNNSMASAANYTALQTRMDVESFIDQQVAQIYFMNTDWPGNNLQYWRKMTTTYQPNAPYGHDGRWRWMLKDTDFGFGLNFSYVTGVNEGPAHNTLAFALAPNGPNWPNPPWSTFIFRRLLDNQQFRHQLINRFCDLMNTVFSTENVLARLEEHRQLYLPEMPEHIQRWSTPGSVNIWQQHITRMANFGTQRPGFMRQHLRNQFSLGELSNITVSSSNAAAGGVRVNRLMPHQIPNPFKGQYFRAIPIEIEAVANPGFRFSHWQGLPAGTPANTTISLTKDTAVVAWFSNSLIHYWHFNNLADVTLTTIPADFSLIQGAQVTYPGMGAGFLDRTDGTLLNANMGAPAGFGLRARNPANTRELIIAAPSTGYRELQLSFAVQRTTNGAQSQELFYSVDTGQNWIKVGAAYEVFIDYMVKTFDLSTISEINNNPGLMFRILFLGDAAAGTAGNNRFDNIAITGVSINLRLDTTNPPAGVVNQFYPAYTFNASGGVPPFTFTLVAGQLPQGLTLASNGRLSGTPTQSGSFLFTIAAADQAGANDQREYLLVVDDKSLIHYWNFNNLPDQVFTNVASDVSMVGAGNITYPGTGAGFLDRTDGSLLNARRSQPAGFGLRVRNPANTRQMIIEAPSGGFTDLVLSFAVMRTNNGAQQQELYYSADGGTNWVLVAPPYDITEAFQTRRFDLSAIAAVNNNPNLRFRILFLGAAAAGTAGNNRFDNITLEGNSLALNIQEPAKNVLSHQNFPNPFSSSTTISFDLPNPGKVQVAVFDSGGRLIRVLSDKWREPGYHEVMFDAGTLPRGIYIYRIITGEGISSRPMLKMN